MNRRSTLAALATIALPGCSASALTGSSDETDTTTETTATETRTADPDALVIQNSHLERKNEGTGNESVVVHGHAENTSDHPIEYAEVTATFLNRQGDVVGQNLDFTTDLEAGQGWRFTVYRVGHGDEARRVENYELEASTTQA